MQDSAAIPLMPQPVQSQNQVECGGLYPTRSRCVPAAPFRAPLTRHETELSQTSGFHVLLLASGA